MGHTTCPHQLEPFEPSRGESSLAGSAHDRSPPRRPSTQRRHSWRHRYKARCERPRRHGVTRSVHAIRVASAATGESRAVGSMVFGGPLLGESDRRLPTSGAAAGRPLPCSDRRDWCAPGCERRLHEVQVALRVARPSARTRSRPSLRHLAGVLHGSAARRRRAASVPMSVRAVHVIAVNQTSSTRDISTPSKGRLGAS